MNLVSKVKKSINNLEKKKLKVMGIMYALFAPINVVYAAGEADAKWNAFVNFLLPWVSRLGGLVLFWGIIEFGLAFKNDDAESKTKGMRNIIAGCIVIAASLSANTFLF